MWLRGSRQTAGRCQTARSRSESLRRRRREEGTQSLFRDNLCFHNMERQASMGPKGKQLSAFQHGRLIGLFILRVSDVSSPCSSRHADGDFEAGFVSQQKSLTCQMWKSPLARDTKWKTKSDRSDASYRHTWRRGLAERIHLTLTESKHMLHFQPLPRFKFWDNSKWTCKNWCRKLLATDTYALLYVYRGKLRKM